MKSATSSQTAAKKNEDRARAEANRKDSLGKLTAADNQLIKSSELAEVEPSRAKKHPANNSPSGILCILHNASKNLSHRMEIKAQKEARKMYDLSSGLSTNCSSNILNCSSLSYRNGLLSHNIRLLSHSCSFRLQCLHLFRISRRSKVTINCQGCCQLNLGMEMDKG